MNCRKIICCLGFVWVMVMGLAHPAYAISPPVRIAIIPASGSGIEQEVVDSLTAQLQGNQNIVLSTVNPDWYVTCRVEDHTDIVALTVRVNGTVTIKTAADGQVLNTISAQTNKQDFSTSGPTPLNKSLVDSAIRELIAGLSQRAVQPIEDAVVTEIGTREKIIKAQVLANGDKYEDALSVLMTITPDTPHFWPAKLLAAQFQMEQEALKLVTTAKVEASRGHYRAAIVSLRQVNQKSKRYRLAQSMIASWSHPTLAKNKSNSISGSQASSNAQLKALEAQKHALDAQYQAIDAQENAIKSKGKP